MEDALFAPPTQPSSAPRIRAFAELALKEIRAGEGGDAGLLADKQAFFDFMDKVNESILLGLREPPAAASVLSDTGDYAHHCRADRGDSTPSSSIDAPAASTLAPAPLRPLEASEGRPSSETVMADKLLGPLSSKLNSAPRWDQHRLPPGHNTGGTRQASPSKALHPCNGVSNKVVRFDSGGDDEDELLGTRQEDWVQASPEMRRFRRRGDDGLGRGQRGSERRIDGGLEKGETSTTRDLAGPDMLQELRRWRGETVAYIDGDHYRPPPPPTKQRQSPPTSGRDPVPSIAQGRDATPPESSRLDADPTARPVAAAVAAAERKHEHGPPGASGTPAGSGRGSGQIDFAAAAELQQQRLRVRGGGGRRGSLEGSMDSGGTGRGAWAKTNGRTVDYLDGGLHLGDFARNDDRRKTVHLGAVPNEQWYDRSSWPVDRGHVDHDGQNGRRFDDSERGGIGDELEAGDDYTRGADKYAGGVRGHDLEGEEKNGTVMSLDLSDCSDEKLDTLLRRGRRRRSSESRVGLVVGTSDAMLIGG